MSDLDLPSFELKKSAMANADMVQVILQCEVWFQARVDQLNEVAEHLKNCESIDLNGMEITVPKVMKGMRIGLVTAVSLLGNFPLKIGG